jgi:hypothetical protein
MQERPSPGRSKRVADDRERFGYFWSFSEQADGGESRRTLDGGWKTDHADRVTHLLVSYRALAVQLAST